MAPPQWAYQVENFVNEPDEELICSICRAVFCDPIMCPCDHVFCKACITKWIQGNRNCPICRKRVSHSSIRQTVPIVKNIILKLTMNCRNKSLGCAAQFSLESAESHVKECQYELVQCKNKPCREKLFRKDIMEHEKSDCPHRCIKCKKCGSKLSTPEIPEKHECIRALQLRIRKKINKIRTKNEIIEKLKNEVKTLKASQNSDRRGPSGSSLLDLPDWDAVVSYFSSPSSSSDSDSSTDDSIIIFTNSLDQSDQSDQDDSDAFLNFMNDNDISTEYSQNESPRPHESVSEYRHAESQTTSDLNVEPEELDTDMPLQPSESSNNPSAAAVVEETAQSLRPVKRAKRRFPPPGGSSTSNTNESAEHSSVQRPRRCWTLDEIETDGSSEHSAESNQGGDHNQEAGPSSSSGPGANSTSAASSKFKKYLRSRLMKRRARSANRATENNGSTNTAPPSRSAVFERTLALLEQYNLESDPEWLPEYASHRGDTPSPSESSDEEFITESSSSELSDSSSNNTYRKTDVPPFIEWMYNGLSTSDEDNDPDWHPLE